MMIWNKSRCTLQKMGIKREKLYFKMKTHRCVKPTKWRSSSSLRQFFSLSFHLITHLALNSFFPFLLSSFITSCSSFDNLCFHCELCESENKSKIEFWHVRVSWPTTFDDFWCFHRLNDFESPLKKRKSLRRTEMQDKTNKNNMMQW